MRKLLRNLVVVLFVAGGAVHGQTKSDEAAVRNVPKAFAAAWAKHDGQELGKIMSEDVDFVNVNGEWLRGRANFVLFHTHLLAGRFGESTLRPLETSIRFLRPDLAVLHWSWRLQNDRNQDLTVRHPRLGLFTMIVEKRHGEWLVAVAQNANWVPPPNPDPEMEGVTPPPIVFPDIEQKP